MSVDIAYPLLRTPDLALALSTARRLMEFGRQEGPGVDVYALLGSIAEVRRVAKELPQGWFEGQWCFSEVDGVPRDELPPLTFEVLGPDLPADPAAYEGRLPVECSLLDQPVGSIEDTFAAVIGPNQGSISWKWLCWPDVPERGLYGDCNHAEVTLLLNTRTREFDEPADDHTVLVHVRSVDVDGRQLMKPYAHWLAEQAGLTIIGPGQPS